MYTRATSRTSAEEFGAPVAARPLSTSPWAMVGYAIIFLANVVGQAMQNIFLPLALSGGADMAVVLIYTAFIYCFFFSILDVILEVFIPHQDVKLHQPTLMNCGFQNSLNGIGAVFGGSSTRTPLTLQMSASLLVNMLSPFYKLWVNDRPMRDFFRVERRSLWHFCAACVLYTISFVLVLIDKLNHEGSGQLSPFCLLFIAGVWFGVTYNVHQDKMISHVKFHHMSTAVSFKVAVQLLRKQLSWLFIFSWVSLILAFIPSFDQAGRPTRATFELNWAKFLPFGNWYMNMFNLGYLISFITSVFMNKFDSSFNMLTSNISAVSSLWTGWMPSIRTDTVGFFPSIPMTVIAIVLSFVAVVPSYKYSLGLRDLFASFRGPSVTSGEYLPIHGSQLTQSLRDVVEKHEAEATETAQRPIHQY
jgi:hypothetical protein